MSDEPRSSQTVRLVYDKECPLCHAYCTMVRIKQTVGRLELVDAREQSDVLDEITRRGLDIDQGMVLELDGVLYYGADAICALSMIGSESGWFNRFNYWVFRSPSRSKWLYPVLRSGRNVVLKLLGRTKVNNLGLQGNDRF